MQTLCISKSKAIATKLFKMLNHDWIWLIGLMVLFGFVSLREGLDVNWDLKNYHLYNAYAFMNDRLGHDIAPAQMQTYFNPILDLPFYYLVTLIDSPRLIAFLMGSLHGIVAFFF